MRVKFIALVLLQALLLAGIAGYRQWWVATGTRVLLRTEPVDPRDLFRGDYVQLTYGITNLDIDQLGAREDFRRNERVYVLLQREADGTYRPTALRTIGPASGTYIQGRVLRGATPVTRWEITVRDDAGAMQVLRPRWFNFKQGDRLRFCLNAQDAVMNISRADSGDGCWNKEWRQVLGTVEEVRERRSRQVAVNYGIENYFVEEGKGRAIEAARNASDLRVEVSLRRDGKGTITGLLMDGKRLR